jgi:nucleoside-diphosphate-sugar epimerase
VLRLLIAGAAGNLGTLLTRHLLKGPHELTLLIHKKQVADDIARNPKVRIHQADLGDSGSLQQVCRNIDCILHLAGVLFRPYPEKYLHVTNTLFVRNLVDVALAAKVPRFILFSFPHVMGKTDPDHRAKEELNGHPEALHSQTRLEAEKYLLHASANGKMRGIVLRAGFIYGPGVKLLEACRKLLNWHLLSIWRNPTWVHLLSLPDFLRVAELAIENEEVEGIYNVCDDEPITLQDFLDQLAKHWGYQKPARLPEVVFYLSAILIEVLTGIFHTRCPISREVLRMGMTSSVADTTRMKKELIPSLLYPTWREGLRLL